MTRPLPLMTDDEIALDVPADEEAGFGALTTGRGPLPLEAMDIRGRIDGLLAQVTVCQTFVNVLDEPLEATYILPLPDRSAVTGFRMEVAGRLVEGILKERAEARRDYARAIEAGHRASVAEEERPGVFTLRVGNLMPGQSATIRLTLAGPLPYADGEVTFRFPLVVAPRYIPGTPLPGPPVGDGVADDTDAVPDASRISPPVLLPGYPSPVRLALSVDIHESGVPVRDIRSSLHAVLAEEGENVHRASLFAGERLNRDFVLRFRLGSDSVGTALSVHPDPTGDGSEGTFALTIVPPEGSAQARRPRDLVFVLDRSGSMQGWKMVAARRAVARMVEALDGGDRFNVYAFDNRIETARGLPESALCPATVRHRTQVIEFLARVDARGGTEMARPLELAVRELAAGEPGRDRVLVLITDGQVGNEDQILRAIGKRLKDVRLFALGIDRAVNEAFLRRLADLGGGSCDLVESEERLDEMMDAIHRRIGTPVLAGIRLEPDGLPIDPDTVAPARLPDLHDGAPLLILGRYRGTPGGRLAIRATDADGRPWSDSIGASVRENPAIASAWARGHLRDLEDRYVLARGDRDEIERRIVATSLRFGVLCRFTAYVAVDTAEVVNEGGQVHRITQPVDIPEDWEMDTDVTASASCMLPEASPRLVAPLLKSYRAKLSSPMASYCMPAEPPVAAPAPPAADRAMVQPSEGLAPIPNRVAGRGSAAGLNLFRNLWRSLFPRTLRQAPNLAACRQLARALGQRLASVAHLDRATRRAHLRRLIRNLGDLIATLKVLDVRESEYHPLVILHRDLTFFTARDWPDEPVVARLWAQAERTLAAFADPPAAVAPPPTQRPEGFWK